MLGVDFAGGDGATVSDTERFSLPATGQCDLALFNLAIDSKLRGCDLVRLQVDDVWAGGRVRDRGTVIQKKTGQAA